MFDRFLPCTASSRLCLDGVVAFDLAAPAQVFTAAPARRRDAALRVLDLLAGRRAGAHDDRLRARPRARPRGARRAPTRSSSPATAPCLDPPPAAVIEALRERRGRGARVLSVCTGAFALAHAGLLDGRRATTHWACAEELAARFPAVEVDPAALYVDEGEVMTSAGLSAGIDLALHVDPQGLRRRGRRAGRPPHGRARRTARAARRSSSSAPPAGAEPGSLEPTRRWAAERLGEPLDVAAMARHAGGQPAHLRPPLPRGDRDDAAAVAALPAGARGAPPARGDRPADRRGRLARRLRHRRLAARPLPPRDRDHARPPTGAPSGRRLASRA